MELVIFAQKVLWIFDKQFMSSMGFLVKYWISLSQRTRFVYPRTQLCYSSSLCSNCQSHHLLLIRLFAYGKLDLINAKKVFSHIIMMYAFLPDMYLVIKQRYSIQLFIYIDSFVREYGLYPILAPLSFIVQCSYMHPIQSRK